MKTWPTDDKIDEIVGGIVTGYAACGLDPLQLKLKDVLVNFNKFGNLVICWLVAFLNYSWNRKIVYLLFGDF